MNRGRITLIAGLVALAAFLVAFGPAPDKEGSENTLRVTSLSAPDSLDPGVSYQSLSWSFQSNVYNSLLTYRKVTGLGGNDVVPDLAEAMPTISADGRTYTFTLRQGIKFAPPVNREVTASDVKYTFDRLALIPSPAPFYHIIEGYDELAKSRKGTVTGIVADDAKRTITFRIKRPDATFLYAFAVNFAAVVPKGTPAKDLSQSGFVPGTGPYMFSSFDPSSHIKLERNPNYTQWSKDTPKGNVDAINVQLKVSDENAVAMLMQGKADLAMSAIPRSKWPFLKSSDEWKPYLHIHEKASTSYIWMNNTAPPFDNVKIRQAVNWAIDRRAMVKLTAGAGTPTSNILPPMLPGAPEAQAYPKRDLAKAKSLISESGVTPGEVTIWCVTTPAQKDMAQYLQNTLAQLGFRAKTRCVDASAYYQIVGNKTTKAQIGFGNWGADFPEASNFISVLLNGATIDPKNSNNLSFYSGKDKEIAKIESMMDLDERKAAWGALDTKMMTEDAPWAPIYNAAQRNLIGKRVGNYVFHPIYDVVMSQVTVDGSGTNNSKTHFDEIGYEDAAAPEGGEAS